MKRKANVATAAVSNLRFAIVGIGASAGGLEAIEQFLKGVPPASGLAFVIVQHQDPTHNGILVEILQRATPLPVVRIKDGMTVEPDHVYVIPPACDLSILHGVLHLLEPTAPRGLRLPIDSFFRALGDDQHERAVGVILSGMGSDGTLGLKVIKAHAGAAFVQTPDSSKFDGMPRSAVDSGVADVVAPPEDLAGKILAFLERTPGLADPTDSKRLEPDQTTLDKIILLLRTQHRHDFSLYKKTTIHRRIERRMGLHQLVKIGDYYRYLRENPVEVTLLFKELLIGVTSFFRDPEVWAQLKTEVFPALFAARPSGGVLRAWVPACSTGEEAFSLAMVFREALEEASPDARFSLQVFATDLDGDAIDRARTGIYPANIAADVAEPRLSRFFSARGHCFEVNKEIREMIVFATQNLILDPPFTKLDILSCRNVLIYFESALQRKILPLFHYSLNPDGILVLGSAETPGQSNEFFTTVPGKGRILRRAETGRRMDLVGFPFGHVPRAKSVAGADASRVEVPLLSSPGLEAQVDAVLLQNYCPAAVLVTSQGDIVYFRGDTGKYLQPPAGRANLNLFAMAREGLSLALSEGFAKAIRDKATVTLKKQKVSSGTGSLTVDITLQSLSLAGPLSGTVLITFADVAQSAKAALTHQRGSQRGVRLAELAQELQNTREEMQTTQEEMQSSQEELQSTNEELQSTNEELQSTNEELTTSKEEMQSMNEELQTVNQEQQARVEELSQTGDDLKNLINSIEIATLFLDVELKVRRFTPPTVALIKLIPGDVGRPVTDLVTTLDYPALTDDAHEVLRTLVIQEHTVAAGDGRWFAVRIVPYRTQDNRIAGLVITFVDVTAAKVLERISENARRAVQAGLDAKTADLAAAKALEADLQKAQDVLEKRFAIQSAELRLSRAKTAAEKKGNQ